MNNHVTVKQCVSMSMLIILRDDINLYNFPMENQKKFQKIFLVGCGTAYTIHV